MKWLTPFAFLLVLSSCLSTQRISYKIGSSESSLELPTESKSLALVNRMRLAYNDRNTGEIFFSNNGNALNAAINGFGSEINGRRYFLYNNTGNAYLLEAGNQRGSVLNSDQVRQQSQNRDLLVSIFAYNQEFNDTYTLDIRRQNMGGNVYREVDFYIGRRTINFTIGFRLYNAKTGAVLDEQLYEEEYFYEAESLQRIRSTQLLNNNFNRELTALGNRYGRLYASRISPVNHFVYRDIYPNGNSWLENGAAAARSENWEEAVKQWERGTKREKRHKQLAMLYHNLAISAERSNNLEQAKKFAQLAANQHPLGVKTQATVGY
jgi:hypothetical protein